MWLLYASLAAIIWGLDYTLGEKIFHDKISPFTLLACEMLLGSIGFFIISYYTQLKSDIHTLANNRILLGLFIAALFTFNIANSLIFFSIKAKNATIAGIIELTYPIFTILFTWLLFKENHLNPAAIVGGLLIFIGAIVVGYSSA